MRCCLSKSGNQIESVALEYHHQQRDQKCQQPCRLMAVAVAVAVAMAVHGRKNRNCFSGDFLFVRSGE
jgi:hypothetical protein